MRKLLNKPWFVAVLVAAAVVFVALSLPSRSPTPSGVAAPVVAEENPPESAAPDGTPTKSGPISIQAALKELTAAPSPHRDPFLSRNAVTAAATEKASSPDLTESVSVSAIWIQSGTTYVLINNRVYHVGDRIGRLTVESANRDGIWVTHWKGRDFVAVGGAFTLVTPARQAAAELSLSSES